MRWLRNMLALAPRGKPQADHTSLTWWNCCCSCRSVSTSPISSAVAASRCAPMHAGSHGPIPFARLAMAALGTLLPRPVGKLLVLDAGFVPKSGGQTWGLDLAWPAPRAGAWKSLY